MKIEDGQGSGIFSGVDSKNRLKTFSVTEDEELALNREGQAWSLIQNTTAVGVGDYVFYLKNTGTNLLAITSIVAFTGAATTLSLDVVSGTPTFTAGADITPVNRNLGSSKTPSATIKEDTNTTGLTNDGELIFVRCAVANTQYFADGLATRILIPQGQAVALRTSAATAVETEFTLIELT